MAASLQRSRPIQRSPPGLGAPAAIGKTCLWNSHSKDVCLPNASSPHPLRGTCRPKIQRSRNRPHALPLYDVKHPRSLLFSGTITNCKNLNRTLKPQPHRGRPPHHTPKTPKKNGGARRDRTDDLKLAKLPLS